MQDRAVEDRAVEDRAGERAPEPVSTDEDAIQAYLALIRMPQPTWELLLAEGIPSGRLGPALTTLSEWGLVQLGPHGAIDVPSPAEAMARHAAGLELRAKQARASAGGLARLYDEARASESADDVGLEILRDLPAVRRASNEVIARARSTVRMFRGMTARTREIMDTPLAAHQEPSIGVGGQVLDVRTIWDSAVLELPSVLEVMAARRDGRETQRFLPLAPISVIVVDEDTCLVEWTGEHREGAQGLLGTSPGAVTAGRALFERFWQLATPLNPSSEADELDERDATVLRLMAAGIADASIARQTGLSQRTVERRVRHLMNRLEARTRFHAGVQAARRHWI